MPAIAPPPDRALAPAAAPIVRAAAGLVLVLAVILLMRLGAPVLVPVVEAIVVWFVLNAMATGLGRLPGLGRWLPRPAALLLSAAIVFLLGFLVLQNVLRTAAAVGPQALAVREALAPLEAWLSERLNLPERAIVDQALAGIGLESTLRTVMSATISTVNQFGIVAIYVGFLLVDQQHFGRKLDLLVRDPERRLRMRALLGRVSDAIQDYLRVMTTMSLITSILSYGVMWAIGMDFALFWATAIFFLNFIPTIGSILGTVLPAVFVFLQYQSAGPTLLVLAGIGLVQFVVGNILLPKVAGRTLNISLFVTMFSLFFFGAIWGVTGMFVAMPATAILVIVLASFEPTRPYAVLLSRTGAVDLPDVPADGA